MLEQPGQAFEGLRDGLRGVMRMDADGGIDGLVLVGQTDAGFKIRRTVACADDQHAFDAGSQGAVDDSFAVGIELRVIQVAVTIDHFRRAPTGTSSRKLASTGLPPSSEAATIIPCDSRPRSLRGARLATITTLRPTRASGL